MNLSKLKNLPFRTKFAIVAGVFMIFGLVGTVLVAQQQQETRSRAAGDINGNFPGDLVGDDFRVAGTVLGNIIGNRNQVSNGVQGSIYGTANSINGNVGGCINGDNNRIAGNVAGGVVGTNNIVSGTKGTGDCPLPGSNNPTIAPTTPPSTTCTDGIDNNQNELIDGGDPLCHTDGNQNNPGSYDPNRSETALPTIYPTVTPTPGVSGKAGDGGNAGKGGGPCGSLGSNGSIGSNSTGGTGGTGGTGCSGTGIENIAGIGGLGGRGSNSGPGLPGENGKPGTGTGGGGGGGAGGGGMPGQPGGRGGDGGSGCNGTPGQLGQPGQPALDAFTGGRGGNGGDGADACSTTVITPTATLIPTATPTRVPTVPPTIPPTVPPTITPTRAPTVTPTVVPGSTSIALNILLHGIGRGGDSANPGSGGNPNPLRTQRNVTVEILNSQNQLILTKTGNISFNPAAGNLTGTVDLGTTLVTSAYTVKVKSTQFLKTIVPGIQNLAQGIVNQLPQTILVNGDIDGSNSINILDYNILIGCYSDFLPAVSCTTQNKPLSDLDDDGEVNQFDYNLFLRELTNREGV